VSARRSCPLCAAPARFVDWGPEVAWIVVDDCSCDGFFVRPVLLDRLGALDDSEREQLRGRVVDVRATGHQAWITTADGRPGGSIEVRTARPEH
jgi:hypothetical protein